MCRTPLVLTLFAASAFAQPIIRVADINPGAASSDASYLTVFDDHLYFRANDLRGGSDAELWRYNGSTAHRVADLFTGPTGSSPSSLAVHGNHLYFAARDSASTIGPRLWKFDGTTATLAPGSSSQAANPEELFSYNGNLYFRGFRSNIGIELWKFDGVNQTPLDLFPGSGSSLPQFFTNYNGQMYFSAGNQPGEGSELARFTGSGATRVTHIAPDGSSTPEWTTVFNSELYFSAYEPTKGRELYGFDGTTATLVADINTSGAGQSSNPSQLVAYNGVLYFSADDGTTGYELYRYDGDAVTLVKNINPNSIDPGGDQIHNSNPSSFEVFNGLLYFAADDGTHGRELWVYDGFDAQMVADLLPGEFGSNPNELTIFQNRLFFSANDGQFGGEPQALLGPAVFALQVPEPSTLGVITGVALLVRRRKQPIPKIFSATV